jgi:hypothetical protein
MGGSEISSPTSNVTPSKQRSKAHSRNVSTIQGDIEEEEHESPRLKIMASMFGGQNNQDQQKKPEKKPNIVRSEVRPRDFTAPNIKTSKFMEPLNTGSLIRSRRGLLGVARQSILLPGENIISQLLG